MSSAYIYSWKYLKPEYKLYWVSTRTACGGVFVNTLGHIIYGAPIFQRWLGKKLTDIKYEIISMKELPR